MSALLKERPQIQEPAGWTEEARSEGRKAGQRVQADNAEHRRALWSEEVVRMLTDGFTYSRTWPTRSTLLKGLRSYNLTHRLSGKGGGQIKLSTIGKWFTEEVEQVLRIEAIEALIAAERIKHQQ